MPRESGEVVFKGEHIPWHLATEVMDYAHLMKGSEDYMNQQYDEALAAIELLEKEDELMFGEDAEWTGRAKRMIRESKEKIKGIGNPPEPKKPEPKPERAPIQFNESDEGVPDMYLSKHAQHTPAVNGSTESNDAANSTHNENDASATYVPKTIAEMRQRHLDKPPPHEYLFYHGLQHYYLSPLDIRILQAAFGSYKNFPSSILPRVERVSSGHVVDDELRKRVKYLGHLPYGCEVGFLECDWTDTVGPEVLKDFATQIEKRRKRHSEKEAREEKDRIRIEKASEREIAAIRRNKRPSIPNDMFSADNLPTLPGSATDSSGQEGGSSPPWAHRTNSAFASLASPGTSPNAQRTVWGTAAVAHMDPDYENLPADSDFRVGDGWLQGWEKDLMREDDELLAQAAQMSLQNGVEANGEANGNAGGGGKGGKKGKKGKKITLMSTSNRRTA